MPLNQAPEKPGEIPGTGPAGGSGPLSCLPGDSGHRRFRLHPPPRRKERTTYDDLFGAAFGKFSAKSICYIEKAAGNDDFMTTQ